MRPLRPAFAFPTILVLLAPIALAACGQRLDTAKLEEDLKKGMMNKWVLPVKSVKCPENIVAKAGDTFECISTMKDGTTLGIKVKQTNDKGAIEWAPDLSVHDESKKKDKGKDKGKGEDEDD